MSFYYDIILRLESMLNKFKEDILKYSYDGHSMNIAINLNN